jgi:RNA polymerase sigma-70 factor, ECF subfamily
MAELCQDTDDVLVEKILSGDTNAESILYAKYQKILTNYLKKSWGGVSYHEDVVSTILIKVFLGLKGFDPKKSEFKSWVYCVAKNYISDIYRNKTIITQNIDFSDWDATIENIAINYSTSNTAEAEFDNKSDVDRLLNYLSPEDFKLLNMKYVEGYSYNEIGDFFNVSSTTACNRVSYLKTKIKRDVVI